VEVIKVLLEDKRFNFRACYHDHFELAIIEGHLNVVILLLRHHITDLNFRPKGEDVLLAAGSSTCEILQLLLNDPRVDVNAVNDPDYHAVPKANDPDYHAVPKATVFGRLDNLKLLLDHQRLQHCSEPQAISELLEMVTRCTEWPRGDVASPVKLSSLRKRRQD
jgi:hypothetical protein